MNVNIAYMFNLTNINFVLIFISYISIYGNLHAPGRTHTCPYLVTLLYQ